jgi:hypothetical protein
MRLLRFTALIVILGFAFTMWHCEPAFAAQGEVSVLTEAQVQKFLKVFPAFAQWIKKNSKAMAQVAEKSNALQVITAARLAEDHQRFFKKQGWTYEEFCITAQNVLMAYAALETQEGLGKGEKDFEAQKAMAEIQKNPDLTPEQKQLMLQQIKQAEESMKTARGAFKDVPPANLALARKYHEAIARVLKEMD